MNKAQLIDAIAANAKLTKADAKRALDAFVTTKKRIQPGKLSKELALLHFLIDNKIAFNVISSSSFDVLAKSWEVLLESKTTIQNLVPVMMELAVELMEDKIHSYPGVSCGVDLWTGKNKSKFLAQTFHGISSTWKLEHSVLDFVKFSGTTKGSLIAAVLEQRIEAHTHKDQLVASITSDGGSDVTRAREAELDFDNELCTNHRLNSILGDVMAIKTSMVSIDIASFEYVVTLIESDKNLLVFFQLLQRDENGSILAFIHRGETRWVSLYLALERYVKLESTLLSPNDEFEAVRQNILAEWPVHLAADVFRRSFFVRLGGYMSVLEGHLNAHLSLQDLKRPTGSQVFGVLAQLKDQWTSNNVPIDGCAELQSLLVQSLDKRCGYVLTSVNSFSKAALLDPSQQSLVSKYMSSTLAQECEEGLLKECVDIAVAEFELTKENARAMCGPQLKHLLQLVDDSDFTPTEKDPLRFYRENMGKIDIVCPIAVQTAKVMLAIPAGESHCERVFSWADGFLTKLRNRTSGETLEMQVVLYDFFRQPYFEWASFCSQILERMQQQAKLTK